MAWYLYKPMLALDAAGNVVRSGTGQIFAENDLTGATPLPLQDINGNTITSVTINDLGLTQAFLGAAPEAVWRSGSFAVPLDSAKGMREAADAAASSAASAAAAAELAADAAAGAASNVLPSTSGVEDGQVLTIISTSPLTLGWADAGSGGGGGSGVSSVNGRTGSVSLTKTDVGLDLVDNTADTDKPVSTATSAAISAAVAGKSNVGHTHSISDITSLQAALDSKLGTSASLSIANLPAGSVVAARKPTGGSWPSRPTSRPDIVVHWVGAAPAPSIVTSGTAGAYDGDIIDLTA